MADVPAQTAPLEAADPARIGGYELVGRLGTGGMGTVYLGRGGDGRQVAVKTIRPEFARDPEFRARFLREAQAARRVTRFCTAEVLDVDRDLKPGNILLSSSGTPGTPTSTRRPARSG